MKTSVGTTDFARRSTTNQNVSSSPDLDIAIIGAGPYGLSVAAHLKNNGLGVRVYGQPMDFWAKQMPAGMLLRSPRAASNLADPRGEWTLESYEAAAGIKPCKRVALETFVNYGCWFREQMGSIVDTSRVSEVTHEGAIFRLKLEEGGSATARRVVVAAGIGMFAKKPQEFGQVPQSLASHCYEGVAVSEFAGRNVAIIGSGQSALECAALLGEAGAAVEVIARIPQLRWIGAHPWLHQMGPISSMLYSKYDVGPIGVSRLVSMPRIVYRFPSGLKSKIRVRAVRPAGAPWLAPRLNDVKLTTGRKVSAARALDNAVQLHLNDGTERRVDHVLLATGYRVDVSGYRFLSPSLVSKIQQDDGYPVVTAGLRSSVPGLYFAGAAAAKSFGPLLYFVAGTEFASRAIAQHVGRNRKNIAV